MFNFIKSFFKPRTFDNPKTEVSIKAHSFKNHVYLNAAEIPKSLIEGDYAVYNCGYLKDRNAFILIPIIKNFDPATNEFVSLTSKKNC